MYGTIVCGVTDAAGGNAAAQLGAALAARLDLRLVLVHVETGVRVDARSTGPVIERALAAIGLPAADGAEVRVVRGNRVDGLARVAAEEGADAIVLGSRSTGARGRSLRCTLARELEAATSVPVLIAPPQTRERSGRRLELAGRRSDR